MSTSPPVPLDREAARELRGRRQWLVLASAGDRLGDEALLAEPEVGYAYAAACRHVGRPERALQVALTVEPEARRRGDWRLGGEVVNLIGNILFETGRVPEAQARFEELLEHASRWNDEEFSARASNNLGVVSNVRGQRDLALTYYQRALAAYQRLGNRLGIAETHANLGISYRDLGFDREADGHFRRSIELALAEGSERVAAIAETERAVLRLRAGDARLATSLARRARDRAREIGDPAGVGNATRVLAGAARLEDRLDEAAAHLDAALEIARAHSDPLLTADVQRDRGLLLRDTGDADGARAVLSESAEHFAQLGATADAEAIAAIVRGMDGDGG
ncbi:tetratricopeptide repeat protein [Longimicrobium sp.]|uniref:tetratricopeptide repeat protein n=1 Tax=Longimicrobium sp. TaxID=2029185 RepID=UPI002E34D375|nr:tetratricopeptide repeat protein [Longimicrobium sp.]HEX6042007.1 tetratricopeptide repeat protein [Longimicrobium sp.]